MENRIEELQMQVDSAVPKKVNAAKFLALVRKYKNCEELTDTMLYEFIDKIVIHAPTGVATVYRQQRIDIYFNFIGEYMPPGEAISEEDRIATIEQEQREKRMRYEKISAERKKQQRIVLKAAAETDPEAAAEYQYLLEKERENRKRYAAKKKAEKPVKEKPKKLTRRELIKAAETNPAAAEELSRLREAARLKAQKHRDAVKKSC